jgi:hypothetical protein
LGSIWKLAHRDPNRNQRIVRHHVSSTHPIAGRDILTGIEGAAGGGGELDIVVRDARDVDGKMADPEELNSVDDSASADKYKPAKCWRKIKT